jgi:hypothetical protein
VSTRLRFGCRAAGKRGQSLVEFAILLPAFMVVLFGMLEFGFAFSHHLTLEYATREGARVGAALAHGTKSVPCESGKPENVDEIIIAAVQRVITSPGSGVPISQVQAIKIYEANLVGDEMGNVNTWGPALAGDGVNGTGPVVDGANLKFGRVSGNWDACGRISTFPNTQSIGVKVIYEYRAITPLGALLKIAGAGSLQITDRTTMALEPFQDG